MQDIKKSFENDAHFDVKIYWISPATLWNSTTVTTLIHSYSHEVEMTELFRNPSLTPLLVGGWVINKFRCLRRCRGSGGQQTWRLQVILKTHLGRKVEGEGSKILVTSFMDNCFDSLWLLLWWNTICAVLLFQLLPYCRQMQIFGIYFCYLF